MDGHRRKKCVAEDTDFWTEKPWDGGAAVKEKKPKGKKRSVTKREEVAEENWRKNNPNPYGSEGPFSDAYERKGSKPKKKK